MTKPNFWQRWFSGAYNLHAPTLQAAADLAVIVIGFRAQNGLIAAVQSLLEQDTKTEIVVVNSGGGDAISLLAAFHGHITIIDIEAPLYVGAARNVGIDASSAPYVAFLAGDCCAKPGWISGRLKHHKKGVRAVASAIALPTTKNAVSLAAHCLLFGLRSPQVRSPQALRYGASYAREVFAQFGYFNTHMRIAEDSAFAQRLGRAVFPLWAPEVLTEHKNPQTLGKLISDMSARGARAARTAQPVSGFREGFKKAQQRAKTANKIAREILDLPATTRFALQLPLALASLSYEWGLARGQAQRQRVDTLTRRADETYQPIPLLEEALALSPESIPLHLRLAELYLETDRTKAEVHIETAIALSCFHAPHAARLSAWLLERKLNAYQQALAQRLAYCLPTASLRSEA